MKDEYSSADTKKSNTLAEQMAKLRAAVDQARAAANQSKQRVLTLEEEIGELEGRHILVLAQHDKSKADLAVLLETAEVDSVKALQTKLKKNGLPPNYDELETKYAESQRLLLISEERSLYACRQLSEVEEELKATQQHLRELEKQKEQLAADLKVREQKLKEILEQAKKFQKAQEINKALADQLSRAKTSSEQHKDRIEELETTMAEHEEHAARAHSREEGLSQLLNEQKTQMAELEIALKSMQSKLDQYEGVAKMMEEIHKKD